MLDPTKSHYKRKLDEVYLELSIERDARHEAERSLRLLQAESTRLEDALAEANVRLSAWAFWFSVIEKHWLMRWFLKDELILARAFFVNAQNNPSQTSVSRL